LLNRFVSSLIFDLYGLDAARLKAFCKRLRWTSQSRAKNEPSPLVAQTLLGENSTNFVARIATLRLDVRRMQLRIHELSNDLPEHRKRVFAFFVGATQPGPDLVALVTRRDLTGEARGHE